ncbi:MAG: RluA family pseudouridine synthase [Kofleriaceae bacterium]|nr:RluA family pseudouridine synthase [Myxococcales bacterium]MCB9559853.1 RluA family pseudouridine synthase [Kofleriaceae bacterium]MCB9571465.1 RluA family pseudouridine synthase [Kofleriaceae bacterium]
MSDADAPGALALVVTADEVGRVDHVLGKRFPDASRRRLAELFADGAVRIRGKLARKGDRVAAGDEITLARAPARADDLRATADPEAAARLTVLYQDDDVVVVDKPAGMPSQPLRPGELGTAAGGVVHLFATTGAVADDPRDGGLVHRLDIGTSGVLIAARHRDAWVRLRAAFGAGEVDKDYLALVETAPVSRECDAPLAQRGRRAVVDLVDGLEAHTSWHEEARYGARRLLRCRATTGRMHQVRAHLAHVGAPLVGDELYGGQPYPGLVGFFLHAATITFPGRGGRITVEAPLSADRAAVIASLTPR